MRVFGLKNCDTCRKALKALAGLTDAVEFVDVRRDGVAREQLAAFYAVFGDGLVNTRSTTWRGLNAEERAEEPLALLAAYPALMKRPVIERDGEVSLGWGKQVQARFAP
ncbi:MAG: arsenate reductase [Rhodobacteraceae bacterium]|nr:arsenate reductase [Paracoccaceae bacterium]